MHVAIGGFTYRTNDLLIEDVNPGIDQIAVDRFLVEAGYKCAIILYDTKRNLYLVVPNADCCHNICIV